jgi:hypothetical protein
MSESKSAYTLTEFAESVSISIDQVRKHIDGLIPPLLEPSYSGTKPLITADERTRWLAELPKAPVRPKTPGRAA